MKRSMALNGIKTAGWDGDQNKAVEIAARHSIGKQAYIKAYLDGKQAKIRGEPRPVNAGKK